MEFFSRDDRPAIKMINKNPGTNHKSKVYDLKNINDLIEATKMTTAECMDLWYVQSELICLVELNDEALEFYHPSIGVEFDEPKNDPFSKAHFQLEETEALFTSLVDKLEKECRVLWEAVLSSSEGSQYFWGKTFEDPRDLESFWKNLWQHRGDIVDTTANTIEASTEYFAEIMRKWLEGELN